MQKQEYEQLTLFPADSPVNHSPLPGSSEAKKMTVSSGQKWLGLSKNSGPLGLLEKMLLESSTWHSTTCYLTWKPKGTPQGRFLYQLAVSVPRIGDTEPQLWPTPRSRESGDYQYSNGNHDKPVLTLSGAVKMWPTPTASDTSARKPGNPIMTKNGTIRHRNKANGQSFMRLSQVFATPQARDFRTGQASRWEDQNRSRNLNDQIAMEQNGGQLNPDWVEAMMGFPVNWTELEE